MKVDYLDLAAATAELRPEIDAAISRVLSSGWYIGGPECEAFEGAFAAYCEARHAVGTANGLDALELALRALGVGPGDEVIVASNTFIATWLAVSALGAKPVPVEPDPLTHNLDPSLVEAAITPETRAILVTHLYGQPADLNALLAIARTHGLKLVEDAAQAHGARYSGRPLGAHSDAVCWSFYPGKNLGALGDGGAVTTDDGALAAEVRRLGNYGSDRKYVNVRKGVNSRLDPIQAAILAVKLKHLDDWNARRASIAKTYMAALQGSSIEPPFVPQWADPAWHLFVVTTSDREQLQQRLGQAGVQTLIHYPIPPHLQQAYADLRIAEGTLPVAERLSREVLSLPIGPHMSEKQVEIVISAVLEATHA